MSKKVRTTQNKNKNKNTNKTTNKKKLGNTKRKLGTKRYKGGVNVGENELKDKYKKMLIETYETLDGIKLILSRQTESGLGHRNIIKLIAKIKGNIDQNTAEELKQKLKLVSDEFKTYAKLPNSGYKSAALLKAQQINAELA
jgi:hypothetical protein